jgi:hypothetical protein
MGAGSGPSLNVSARGRGSPQMLPAVLAELRLLSSARLDSHILLTVVLAGEPPARTSAVRRAAPARQPHACAAGSRTRQSG